MSRPRLARPPLTLTVIRSATPDSRDRFLWDGTEHGLGLKITPAGSRVFILQKSIAGQLKRMTLGNFPDMTLDAARIEARKLNGRIAAGGDPIAEAKAERAAAALRAKSERTVSELWARYDREVIAVENRPSTAGEKRRMWKSRIEPAIGRLKVRDVTDQDAGAIVRAPFRLDQEGQVIGGRGEGGNLYRLLHHMFEKALAWKLRPREFGNPLEEVAQPKVARRERLLSADEVGAIMEGLDQALAKELEHKRVVAAIRAATFTGARISEILGLRPEEVRPDDMEVHLADTKSGFSIRPISGEALAAIRSVEAEPDAAFVFPSFKDRTRPLSYTTVAKAFRRIAGRAGVRNCTLHTLRHWFTTLTANSVNNPRVGMKLTGHKSLEAYMNYVHADRSQAAALAEQLGTLAIGLGRKHAGDTARSDAR